MTSFDPVLPLTDNTLTRMWDHLLADESFSRGILWMVFLDAEQRLLPVVIPVEEIPEVPAADEDGLRPLVEQMIAEGMAHSVALCLSRPGDAAFTPQDAAWCDAMFDAMEPARRQWPVHVATAAQTLRIVDGIRTWDAA